MKASERFFGLHKGFSTYIEKKLFKMILFNNEKSGPIIFIFAVETQFI